MCNPLIVPSLDFVQTSAHVQKRTQLSKLICGVSVYFEAKTLLLIYLQRFFNQIFPIFRQYCLANRYEPFFLISYYFRFYRNFCLCKRAFCYNPIFKICFFKQKQKSKKRPRSAVGILFESTLG